MAQEIRKIEFDLVETHVALQILCKKTGTKIPSDVLSSIRNDGESTTRLIATFGVENTKSLPMRDKDMLTALLVFCQEKAIPVPKGGKKMIKAEGDKVVLLVKMD